MFELSEDKITELIEMYEVPRSTINEVQRRVNIVGVIDDESVYEEVVEEVVSSIMSIRTTAESKALNSFENESNKKVNIRYSMDDEIKKIIDRKFADFGYMSPRKWESYSNYFRK